MYTVAVYGSLKRGRGNHSVMPRDAKFLGEGRTFPEFTMIDMGAYPGVIKRGDTEVLVELWEMEDISTLDLLESNGSFYTRQIQPIQTAVGEMDAWIYLLPSTYLDVNVVVQTGEW